MYARTTGRVRHCEAAAGHNGWMTPVSPYVTRPLSPDTWDDFARLVEANNGVWGGCWCIGFHPEGVGKGHTVSGNRLAKQAHVRNGTVHPGTVDGDECVGWCQYTARPSYPEHQEPESLRQGPGADARLADRLHLHWERAPAQWGCAGGSRRRAGRHPRCWRWARRSVPRASRGARPATRRLFHTGPADLFEEFGFERDRKIAKWRWAMRLRIQLTECCRSVAAVGGARKGSQGCEQIFSCDRWTHTATPGRRS